METAFQLLKQSINKQYDVEDKINPSLINQYPNCLDLYQEMLKKISILNPNNIHDCLNIIHSLKGHVRNIGCLVLGLKYHQLESILQFIIENSFNEYKNQFDEIKFNHALNMTQTLGLSLMNQIQDYHLKYINGNFYQQKGFFIEEDNLSIIIDKLIENKNHVQSIQLAKQKINEKIQEIQSLSQYINPNDLIFYITRFLSDLEKNFNYTESFIQKQDRNNQLVLDNLLKTRLVSLEPYYNSFHETVKNTSLHKNIQCTLNIKNDNIQLDKTLMDKINFIVNHLLNNAVIHGVENNGQIDLIFKQFGHFLSITIKDNGKGIDLNKIKSWVINNLPNIHTDSYTEKDWLNMIFYSGLSTRENIDEYSGRGIGLNSVKKAIYELGGQIEVEQNNGTIFTITIPNNHLLSNLMIVKVGTQLFAIPNILIETTFTIPYQQYQNIKNQEFINLKELYESYAGSSLDAVGIPNKVPFADLNKVLNIKKRKNPSKFQYIMVLNYLGEKSVFSVDDILYKTEKIIENVGKIQQTNGVMGAVMLNHQESALVINPILMMNFYQNDIQSQSSYVLIVDDSPIACLSTQQSLQKVMIQSIAKQDGDIAYDFLLNNLDNLPYLILTDFEMPNMNGLELTKKLKSNPKLSHIPIIMITSKSLESYQQEAEKQGVFKLLGKPFNEVELLNYCKQL